MYHYSSPPPPPPGWSSFDYLHSPPTSPQYAYYPTQFASPYASPRSSSRRHHRKASYAAPTGAWHSGYGQGFYEAMPGYGTPSGKHDPVSAFSDGYIPCGRRRTMSTPAGPEDFPSHHFKASHPRAQQGHSPVLVDSVDDVSDDQYDQPPATPRRDGGDRPRRKPSSSQRKARPPTDSYYSSDQVPAYDDHDSSKRYRARRQSTSTRSPPKPKPKPPATAEPPPEATAEDAARAGIPPRYSLKYWDPTEMPILLLGSVFDANSLGKWIFDWTVFHHGKLSPILDTAGELWLLMIALAGRMKHADTILKRIGPPKARGAPEAREVLESREVLEGFVESGERLWARLRKLLRACEQFMLKAAKRENGGKRPVSLGHNEGCEFVESIFGRDREMENTESLMTSIRLWSLRFDANCEDVLKRL